MNNPAYNIYLHVFIFEDIPSRTPSDKIEHMSIGKIEKWKLDL